VFGLSIGQVANQAGIRASTIRYYERVGLLPQPPRTSGRCRYDEGILERLAIVHFAKRVGFTICEIQTLLSGSPGRPPPENWRRLAHAKLAEMDQFMSEAAAVRQMLLETLDQKCPQLVERGASLRATAPKRKRANLR
jgi:MerR family redox-sensitive transcriptional activator SoxR